VAAQKDLQRQDAAGEESRQAHDRQRVIADAHHLAEDQAGIDGRRHHRRQGAAGEQRQTPDMGKQNKRCAADIGKRVHELFSWIASAVADAPYTFGTRRRRVRISYSLVPAASATWPSVTPSPSNSTASPIAGGSARSVTSSVIRSMETRPATGTRWPAITAA